MVKSNPCPFKTCHKAGFHKHRSRPGEVFHHRKGNVPVAAGVAVQEGRKTKRGKQVERRAEKKTRRKAPMKPR